MRAWQFDVAEQGITDARGVLRQRAALQREASRAGLILPASLEAAFEGNGGLAAAAAEASAELATVGALEAAQGTQPADPNVLQKIGLLGAPDPQLRLADGKHAFAAGDLDAALAAATEFQATWTGAEETGRGRLVSVVLLPLSHLLLLGQLVQAGRRARRRLRTGGPAVALPYNRRPSGPKGGIAASTGSVGEGGDGDRSGGAR
jgi:hypothetical protein